LQGIQIWIEWQLFGANAAGYHLIQILIHAVNCWLLFALVARVAQKAGAGPLSVAAAPVSAGAASTPPTGQGVGALPTNAWRLGFLAAFFYATFPVYALAVNWINITDPMMTLFYLASVGCWLNYLEHRAGRDYALALLMFVVALSFKQMALTLPAILFLLDVLLVNSKSVIASPEGAKQSPSRTETPALPKGCGASVASHKPLAMTLRSWIRRYAAFGVIVAAFFAIQYWTRSTHTFAGVFGYTVGPHIISIIAQYLSLLAFPWGYYPATDTQVLEFPDFIAPVTVTWMLVALAIYLLLLFKTRNRALVFIGAAIFIALLPVLPFPFIELRYLYLPAMGSAILLALLFDHALSHAKLSRLSRPFASFALALLVLGNASAIANANAGIYEIARQRRVPFRDISLQHPTFPDDTHLYFIDSISPLSELAGMFTLRYGPGVTVGGNTAERVTNPRDHKNAFVYYFDETGKPREVAMEPTPVARPSPALPVNFQAPIALEQVEIARSTVKRGDVLIALLYWRASGNIDKDYTVFLHLVNENGQTLAGYDSQPRKSDVPTSKWLPYQLVVDAIVMPIPREISPANDYKLEVGLYYLPTLQRLSIVGARGQPIADTLAIEPLSIIE
jgi:hypothetical protein